MEYTENTKRMPLDLQFFADEGATEESEAGQEAGGADGAASSGADKEKPIDLNKLLADDPAMQSQYDKLVGKALQTARGKWENEKNMTAEQLAAQKTKEREDALTAKEIALGMRERRAAALGMLAQKGLPPDLVDCVALTDDDTMTQSLEKVEKAYRASVDAAVKSKLQGTPPQGAGEPSAAQAAMRKAMGLK